MTSSTTSGSLPSRMAAGQWSGEHFQSSLVAAAVLACGFLLRLRAASGTFFNPDEALHVLAANQTSLAATYQASLDTAHPPLLLFILYWWRILGMSEWVLRLPSVIAGAIFCWVFFRWLSSVFGDQVAWAGLLFAGFLPPLIELSAEVRQYALLLCFVMLATYYLERALAAGSATRMLISVFFLYLAMLTHFSAILFAAAVGGYSLLRLMGSRPSRSLLAVWGAGMAGALGLFLFLYRTQISQLNGSDVARRMMEQLLSRSYFHYGRDHMLLFPFARTFGVIQWVFGQLAVGDVAGLLFFVGVILLFRSEAHPGTPPRRMLGIFLLLPFAINCLAAMVDIYPYGGTRHSAFLAPFALAGVGFAVVRLSRGHLWRAVAGTVVIVAACHLFGTPHRPYMLRPDQGAANMARAIESIHREVPPADPMFVDFQTYFMIRFYLCPEVATAWDSSIAGFRSFACGKYKVISTEPDINIFSAEAFLPSWQKMTRAFQLKPGQAVWIFQAGWDIGLAQQLKKDCPQFRNLNFESFGRNLSLFKLVVASSGAE